MEESQLVRNLWDDFELIHGGGTLHDRGVCVMQAVAYVSGETDEYSSTDHPQCVHAHLSEAFIGINDTFTTEQRAKLRPFIPRLLGTVMHDRLTDSEKSRMEYSKVDYAKLLYARIAEDIDRKKDAIKDKYPAVVFTEYLSDYEGGKNGWHESTLAIAVTAFIQVLGIEQGILQPQENVRGHIVFDGDHYKVIDKINVQELLDHIDQVLPPAKPYIAFQGGKVNVLERIHKMVGYWRTKKGIKTEWPHEEGLVVED